MPDRDAPSRRRLQPWGVVCWRGRWYVVGHDLDREATRCFRLSRVVGAVRVTGAPGAYEPPAERRPDQPRGPLVGSGGAHRPGHRAGRAGRAAGLRRWAVQVTAGPDGDRLVLPYADPEALAGHLVGYGPDVRVLDPPEVREAVIQRLKEIAVRHDELAVRGGAR